MVTAADIQVLVPDAYAVAKEAEKREPLVVGDIVVHIPDGRTLRGNLTVAGAHLNLLAYIVKELDDRTALITGLFEGQDFPAMLRVMRKEIARAKVFASAVLTAMHQLGMHPDIPGTKGETRH